MKLPKFLYQFSYQREGIWILFFTAMPLLVFLLVKLISYLAH